MKIVNNVTKKDMERIYYLSQKSTDKIIIILAVIFYIGSIFEIMKIDPVLSIISVVIFYFIMKGIICLYGKLFSKLTVKLLSKHLKPYLGETITNIKKNGITFETQEIKKDIKWEDITKLKIFKNEFMIFTKDRVMMLFSKKDFKDENEYFKYLEIIKNSI